MPTSLILTRRIALETKASGGSLEREEVMSAEVSAELEEQLVADQMPNSKYLTM